MPDERGPRPDDLSGKVLAFPRRQTDVPPFPPFAPRIGIALAAIGVLATTAVAANAAIRTETRPVDPAASVQPTSSTTVATPPETTFLSPTSSSSGGSPAPVTTHRHPATTQKPKPIPPASGQQAVLAFTSAIDRGDVAAAWRVLAPRSQSHWRTQARFAASMDKIQQGGWAGWTADRGRTARSVVINSSGDGEVLIVTLRGTTMLDGRTVPRATAFPVRHGKDSFLVELWDVGVGETTPRSTHRPLRSAPSKPATTGPPSGPRRRGTSWRGPLTTATPPSPTSAAA